MSEIVVPKSTDFGIVETKAHEINAMFQPMLESMVELEKQYNILIDKEVTDDVCEEAKELAKEYKEVRIKTEKDHKALKEFYLKGGRFVDSWKNAQINAAGDKEKSLKYLANYQVNKEKERVEAIQLERHAAALPYCTEEEILSIPRNLGEMSDKMWAGYLNGLRNMYEEGIISAKKAEEEATKVEAKRVADEKKLKAENEKLKKATEKAQKEKDDAQAKIDKLQKEKRESALKEAGRVAAEKQKLADKAQEEKDKQEALKEAELNKGDGDKMNELISELETIGFKYSFKSKSNKELFESVRKLLGKTVTYIEERM